MLFLILHTMSISTGDFIREAERSISRYQDIGDMLKRDEEPVYQGPQYGTRGIVYISRELTLPSSDIAGFRDDDRLTVGIRYVISDQKLCLPEIKGRELPLRIKGNIEFEAYAQGWLEYLGCDGTQAINANFDLEREIALFFSEQSEHSSEFKPSFELPKTEGLDLRMGLDRFIDTIYQTRGIDFRRRYLDEE